MVSVQIKGAEQLGDLAKRLKAQGESGKGLRQELQRGITAATKDPRAQARRNTSRLPQGGGLAALIKKARLSTSTRTAGRNAGVRVIAKGDAVRSTDRGTVRHPVPNSGAWVTQSVPPGWFTEAMQDSAPKVRREIVMAMATIARRITKG